MKDKLAAHATSQTAGTVALVGHCHLAFRFAGQVKGPDGREEGYLLLFPSDSLTYLLKDVLETVYHTVEEF